MKDTFLFHHLVEKFIVVISLLCSVRQQLLSCTWHFLTHEEVLKPSAPDLTLASQFPLKAGGPQVLEELGEGA